MPPCSLCLVALFLTLGGPTYALSQEVGNLRGAEDARRLSEKVKAPKKKNQAVRKPKNNDDEKENVSKALEWGSADERMKEKRQEERIEKEAMKKEYGSDIESEKEQIEKEEKEEAAENGEEEMEGPSEEEEELSPPLSKDVAMDEIGKKKDRPAAAKKDPKNQKDIDDTSVYDPEIKRRNAKLKVAPVEVPSNTMNLADELSEADEMAKDINAKDNKAVADVLDEDEGDEEDEEKLSEEDFLLKEFRQSSQGEGNPKNREGKKVKQANTKMAAL